MPTAISAQIKIKRATSIPRPILLFCLVVTIVLMISYMIAKVQRRKAAMMKSLVDQSTSSVSCIAIKGIIKMTTMAMR